VKSYNIWDACGQLCLRNPLPTIFVPCERLSITGLAIAFELQVLDYIASLIPMEPTNSLICCWNQVDKPDIGTLLWACDFCHFSCMTLDFSIVCHFRGTQMTSGYFTATIKQYMKEIWCESRIGASNYDFLLLPVSEGVQGTFFVRLIESPIKRS